MGSVTTGPAGGAASASITGPAGSQVLSLTIPQGPSGPGTGDMLKSQNLAGLTDQAQALQNIGANRLPIHNLLIDDGRFSGINAGTIECGSFDAGSGILGVLLNGATIADSGKFIYNNSTNGGVSGPISTSVQSLLAAVGRTGNYARSGPEYWIAKITAGADTGYYRSIAGKSMYSVAVHLGLPLDGGGLQSTLVFWVRAVTGVAGIYKNGVQHKLYKNGVEQADSFELSSAWCHVRMVRKNPIVIYGDFFRICSRRRARE